MKHPAPAAAVARALHRQQTPRRSDMKSKANGKKHPRRSAGDDPGFTATQGSSSRPSEPKEENEEELENRDSGLKQAGLSDVGGAAPRRKNGNGRK
jgi:hypothetical protein